MTQRAAGQRSLAAQSHSKTHRRAQIAKVPHQHLRYFLGVYLFIYLFIFMALGSPVLE